MNLKFRTTVMSSCAVAVSIFGTSALIAYVQPANAAAPISYPCIIGGPVNADSKLALKVAKLAFQTEQTKAFDAGKEVRDKCKEVVVWPADEGGIESDTTQFVNSPSGGESKLICVQKNPYEGTRFVVRQKPFNWEGDWFSILLLTAEDKPAEIFKKIDSIDLRPEDLPEDYVVVTSGTWQRPWILKNPANGKYLAIDTQHPAEFMSDWTVFAPTKEGKAKTICKIRFKPPAKNAVALLPKGPLSQIAVLLDQIIGKPKADEGTFHATDRLRLEVDQMWGNLLFRPWAILEPDESRASVEKHLKRWSRGAAAYRSQYARLQALYPQAIVALTQYYEQSLRKPHAGAQKMATTNLDIAYRSHFKL